MKEFVKYLDDKIVRTRWIVFCMFALVLFVKTMCFHFYTGQSILLSSVVSYPMEFFRFWNGKILPSLFLGAFVFVSKRYWWTIVANIIVDIWAIANLFYYKANSLFLTYDTMKLLDNMDGFWDSLLLFLDIDILSFLLITIVYTILLICIAKRTTTIGNRSWGICGVLLLISLLLAEFDMIFFSLYYQSWTIGEEEMTEKINIGKPTNQFHSFFPFGYVYYCARTEDFIDANYMSEHYIRDNSIISYFPASLLFKALQPSNAIMELSKEQQKILSDLILPLDEKKDKIPNSNLIIILVESLESWALDSYDDYCYCPNMAALSKNEHTLYCPNLKSQALHGNSGDGQMIVLTGILPIKEGATCVLYGTNQFPGYAECYPSSAIFSQDDSWKQSVVTYSYQFKELLMPPYTHTHTRAREETIL